MKKINILNLKCNGCANTIKKGLSAIEGVEQVDVALENAEITINDVSEDIYKKVKDTLSKMGYPEVGDANSMLHKAKSIVSCATGKLDKN